MKAEASERFLNFSNSNGTDLSHSAGANVQSPGDPLGDALDFLRMSETSFGYFELTSPWSIEMTETCSKFHFVLSGRCSLEVCGEPTCILEAGDFALVPNSEGHRLSSDPSIPSQNLKGLQCERLSRCYARFTNGGDGRSTTVFSGDVIFGHPAATHLFSLLPKIMKLRSPAYHMLEWLHSTARLLSIESRELRPGGEAMIARLADVMVMQTIRSWIEQNPLELTGWLSAFRDPAISRAIALIHRDPGGEWTIASLAKSVGMSRSSFAVSFAQLVGEPPMQYVLKWRMHLARIHLRADQKGLEEIAPLLGYQSGAAFSRAFKRTYGASPGAVRRAALDGTDQLRAAAPSRNGNG